jgi:hypothetical protein
MKGFRKKMKQCDKKKGKISCILIISITLGRIKQHIAYREIEKREVTLTQKDILIAFAIYSGCSKFHNLPQKGRTIV